MKDPLSELRIKSPCSANWEPMSGNEKVKFCNSCQKSVFNLSELSRKQAVKLIQEKNYNLCVKIHRDEKGKIITNESSPLMHSVKKNTKQFVSGVLILLLSVSAFVLNSYAAQTKDGRRRKTKARSAKIKKKIERKSRIRPTIGVVTTETGDIAPPLASSQIPQREAPKTELTKDFIALPTQDSEIDKAPPVYKKP